MKYNNDDELAADSREVAVAEVLDPKWVESTDDASWGSDSPQMRSNASESKHDGTSNAKLAETDRHDPADMNDNDMMNGVSDVVRDIDDAMRGSVAWLSRV